MNERRHNPAKTAIWGVNILSVLALLILILGIVLAAVCVEAQHFVNTKPNAMGGRNLYIDGQLMYRSRRNAYGGETWVPSAGLLAQPRRSDVPHPEPLTYPGYDWTPGLPIPGQPDPYADSWNY